VYHINEGESSYSSYLLFLLPMGYNSDSDPPIYSGMSGKKLGILVGVIALGSFIAVQAMFGFPIKDLVRNKVIEESK